MLQDDRFGRVHTVKDLVAYYHAKHRSPKLLIGIEWERSGIVRDTGRPVHYKGSKGYFAVLKKLVDEMGWIITKGNRKFISELTRGASRITLEGDGRLELSSSPRESLHDLAREFRLHANEVQEMGNFFNIGWLPLGLQPIHGNRSIPFLERARTSITYSAHGNETYTKRTNGLAINFSASDEKSAIEQVQTAFRVMPILGAMFASSPLDLKKRSPYLDTRRQVIKQLPIERSDLPKNILSPSFSFEEWIEFYLDKPLILIVRPGMPEKSVSNLTFRQWIKKGVHDGLEPTFYDFDQLVKTVWSDIRLRPNYIEYRVLDSVPIRFVMSAPALMKGLLFHEEGRAAAAHLTRKWKFDDVLEIDRNAWKHGLGTLVQDKSLLWYADALLNLANEQLHGFHRKNWSKEDETLFLKPLKQQIYIKEQTIADEIAKKWETVWNRDPRQLLAFCEDDFVS